MYEHKPINSFFCCNMLGTCCTTCLLGGNSQQFYPIHHENGKFSVGYSYDFWNGCQTRQMSIAHPLFQGPSDASGTQAISQPRRNPQNSGQQGCKRPYIVITKVLSSSCFLVKAAVFIACQGKGQSHKQLTYLFLSDSDMFFVPISCHYYLLHYTSVAPYIYYATILKSVTSINLQLVHLTKNCQQMPSQHIPP